jgi:hypothetical protein
MQYDGSHGAMDQSRGSHAGGVIPIIDFSPFRLNVPIDVAMPTSTELIY